MDFNQFGGMEISTSVNIFARSAPFTRLIGNSLVD